MLTFDLGYCGHMNVLRAKWINSLQHHGLFVALIRGVLIQKKERKKAVCKTIKLQPNYCGKKQDSRRGSSVVEPARPHTVSGSQPNQSLALGTLERQTGSSICPGSNLMRLNVITL